MIRRIEIAWPITDSAMQTRIMQECVEPYLSDTADAWILAGGGVYQALSAHHHHGKSAQKMLIDRYSKA